MEEGATGEIELQSLLPDSADTRRAGSDRAPVAGDTIAQTQPPVRTARNLTEVFTSPFRNGRIARNWGN